MAQSKNSHYDKWQRIMDDWQASDLSQPKYCQRHQLDFRQFKYYRQRLHEIDYAQAIVAVVPLQEKQAAFAPVQIGAMSVPPLPAHESHKLEAQFCLGVALKLNFKTGLQLEIPSNCTSSQLKNLLEVLQLC